MKSYYFKYRNDEPAIQKRKREINPDSYSSQVTQNVPLSLHFSSLSLSPPLLSLPSSPLSQSQVTNNLPLLPAKKYYSFAKKKVNVIYFEVIYHVMLRCIRSAVLHTFPLCPHLFLTLLFLPLFIPPFFFVLNRITNPYSFCICTDYCAVLPKRTWSSVVRNKPKYIYVYEFILICNFIYELYSNVECTQLPTHHLQTCGLMNMSNPVSSVFHQPGILL